eukprot:1068765_1
MAQLFDDSEGATFITRRRHRPVPHLHDENPNLDRDRDDRLNNVNYRKPRTYMHVIAYGILLVVIMATYIIDRNRIIALSAESMTLRETIEQTTNHTRTLQGQVYKLTQDIQYMKQKHDDKKKEIEELESKYNAFEKEIESRALKNDGVSQTTSDDIQFSYGWSSDCGFCHECGWTNCNIATQCQANVSCLYNSSGLCWQIHTDICVTRWIYFSSWWVYG